MKTFMTSSKSECLEVAKVCFANAESKYKDGLALAEIKSYGNAISQLIVSIEEMMKGTILNLDGNGFHFRSRVKGLKSIFDNHRLRYYLAFILSVVNILGQDIIKMIHWTIENHKNIPKIDFDDKTTKRQITAWLIRKMRQVESENNWFSKIELLRQDGFYVGFSNKIKSPQVVTQREYMEFQIRVEKFRQFVIKFNMALDINDPLMKKQIRNAQKMFIRKRYYTKLGELVPFLNSNAFERIKISEEFIQSLSLYVRSG